MHHDVTRGTLAVASPAGGEKDRVLEHPGAPDRGFAAVDSGGSPRRESSTFVVW